MAKRASLSGQKASALLNLRPTEEATEEGQAPPETVGAAVLDHIGHDVVTTQRVVEEVPLSRIRANPFQPRWAVDEGTVAELAHSMRQRGFFGALTARKSGRWYELAYGHQRFEAARRAGLETLPLEVRDLSDEEMLEYALGENLQRKDLSQLEEGEMFVRWQSDLGRSEREIAERLGKSRGYVRNRIETARLPDDLKQILREQASNQGAEWEDTSLPPRFELSPAAAKELARVADGEMRRRLLGEVMNRQLSFQQTRLLVERALNPPRQVSPTQKAVDPENEHMFGKIMLRLEEEARRVRPGERVDAIRALEELIARAEQIRDSLKQMR